MKNYKSKIKNLQLTFNFDLTNSFDMDNEIFLVHNIIEEMNLNVLKSAYSKRGRKPVVEPIIMFKILVFSYLNRKFSARDIEEACKYDLRYKWLLNHQKSPDHVTINRFRNKIYPSNYEVKKTRKYKNDISKKENMTYLKEGDYYFCKNNKKLEFEKIVYRKNKYGFKSHSKVYVCKECSNCEYSKDCIKSRTNKNPGIKRIYYSERFENLRKESEFNIKSQEGIIERINRPIQAEGIFSYIKSGMEYSRFRHKGMEKTIGEMKLLSLAINIKKLNSKIASDNVGFIKYKEAI